MGKLVEVAEILSNKPLSPDGGVVEMWIRAPQIASLAVPGQFLMLKNEAGNTFLRRPFGVADVKGDSLSVIYRVVGKGTNEFLAMKQGDSISLEGPLGNGFNIDFAGKALLVGGGVGLAPLIYTARKLKESGNSPIAIIGMKTAAEAFWQEFFKEFAADMLICTDDGSAGIKGFAVDALPKALETWDIGNILACGPTPMMEAVANIAKESGIPCQVSLEKRMACAFGVCLACTFEGKSGKRWKVCADGPVFDAGEVF